MNFLFQGIEVTSATIETYSSVYIWVLFSLYGLFDVSEIENYSEIFL